MLTNGPSEAATVAAAAVATAAVVCGLDDSSDCFGLASARAAADAYRDLAIYKKNRPTKIPA